MPARSSSPAVSIPASAPRSTNCRRCARSSRSELAPLGLRAAVAGTHPFAQGEDTEVSGGARYQVLYEKMRELARREPTFALHVHVGVPDPELAILAADRIRAHLPLILAVSANSPYWRGRDSGMASFRTPLFQAFPRSGIPRRFGSYAAYVDAVDLMLRAELFPEPTFIWWDVRVQPRFGTVEVRIADAQTTSRRDGGHRGADPGAGAAGGHRGLRPAGARGGAGGARGEPLPRRSRRHGRPPDRRRRRRPGARRASSSRSCSPVCEPHADDLGSRAELDELRALDGVPRGGAPARRRA